MYNIVVYNLTYKEARNLIKEMEDRAAFDIDATLYHCKDDFKYNIILLITTSDNCFCYPWWQTEHIKRIKFLRKLSKAENQDMDYYVTNDDEAARELINCLIE